MTRPSAASCSGCVVRCPALLPPLLPPPLPPTISLPYLTPHSNLGRIWLHATCPTPQLLPEYKDAEIVRSRDPEALSKCDIVIDVGGTYDHEACRYDHHQRGFDEVLGGGFNTKLSACGLVYKHYGRAILRNMLSSDTTDAEIEEIYFSVYKSLIESIDAIDNGISTHDGEPRYRISTDLSSRVGRLNPSWDEDQDFDACFVKAMALTGSEFSEAVGRFGPSWAKARKLVQDAVEKRKEIHPSGQVILLENFCPWKEHLAKVETLKGLETSGPDTIKYCVYTSSGMWRVDAVPVSPGSFESRKKLPEPWRGVRDAALSEAAGIADCTFVHAGGFTGGNKTREGILAMVDKALSA